MARAKKAPVVKSVIIEGAPVIERAIVRFSHIVLQFTVENGDQISYEVLETPENPEVADAIEYATVRFSEVVCQFVVTDGTTVHAYELEPVYQEIGGGPTPPEPPTFKVFKGKGVSGTAIVDNPNRALTEEYSLIGSDLFYFKWNNASPTTVAYAIKFIADNGDVMTGPQYRDGVIVSEPWLTDTSEHYFSNTNDNLSGVKGARILFENAASPSTPITYTLDGTVSLNSNDFELVETDPNDFE